MSCTQDFAVVLQKKVLFYINLKFSLLLILCNADSMHIWVYSCLAAHYYKFAKLTIYYKFLSYVSS